MGARLLASTPAGHAAFQLGSEPWYGYWYGVILELGEGAPLGFGCDRIEEGPFPGEERRSTTLRGHLELSAVTNGARLIAFFGYYRIRGFPLE